MNKTLITMLLFIVFSTVQARGQEISAAASDKSSEQKQSAENTGTTEEEKTVLRNQLLQQFDSILQTRDTARGLVITISNSLFQLKGSELTPPALEKLSKIAVIVSSHPSLELEIEGHAEGTGSEDSNKLLSVKIAQSVQSYLVSQGVSSDKIVIRGFGEAETAGLNDPSQVRQLSRRVEIFVSGEIIGGMIVNAK